MAIESLKCHNHRGRALLEKTETCKETGGLWKFSIFQHSSFYRLFFKLIFPFSFLFFFLFCLWFRRKSFKFLNQYKACNLYWLAANHWAEIQTTAPPSWTHLNTFSLSGGENKRQAWLQRWSNTETLWIRQAGNVPPSLFLFSIFFSLLFPAHQ